MRREWWWAIAASTILALSAAGAQSYVTLVAPYYAVAARWIARGHPSWEVVDVNVAPGASGRGAIVRLRGTVRERAEDRRPAMRLISKLQVAAVMEAPVVFWLLLVLWPLRSYRDRLWLLALGVPVFLCLEAATTVCQLLNPLAYGSAALAGHADEITAWERWSRFLEAGGRAALALLAALLTIAAILFTRGTSIGNNSRLHS